jgi:hypothetical protein
MQDPDAKKRIKVQCVPIDRWKIRTSYKSKAKPHTSGKTPLIPFQRQSLP